MANQRIPKLTTTSAECLQPLQVSRVQVGSAKPQNVLLDLVSKLYQHTAMHNAISRCFRERVLRASSVLLPYFGAGLELPYPAVKVFELRSSPDYALVEAVSAVKPLIQ